MAHDVIQEIERLWDDIKVETAKDNPDKQFMNDKEWEMTKIAKRFWDWSEGKKGIDFLSDTLIDQFRVIQLWRLTEDDESEELKYPEKRKKLIETAQETMKQFGFTPDKLKEILRAEYNRRYKQESTTMFKNGKITPFGQRVNRMMKRLKSDNAEESN